MIGLCRIYLACSDVYVVVIYVIINKINNSLLDW